MENSACESESSQLHEAAALTPTMNSNSENVGDDVISSTTSDKIMELATSSSNCDAEADFLEAELSMSSLQTEKITENVEDIVQDLENLLGESADGYRFDTNRDSYAEINSTQGSQCDKLYENLENELNLHLSSNEISSFEKGIEDSVLSENCGTDVNIVEKNECEPSHSDLFDIEASCTLESNAVPQVIDSNPSEHVDNSIIPDNLVFTNVTDEAVCQINQEESESVPQISEVNSEYIAPANEEILKLDRDIENLKMESETEQLSLPECSLQSEDMIAIASIIQEAENSEVFQDTENIGQPIPDTSTEVLPSQHDDCSVVKLSQPLTVEVDESVLRTEDKKEESVGEVTDETEKAPLKMTITKVEKVHSILKIYDPTEPLEAKTIEKPVQEESILETTASLVQQSQTLSPLKITIQNIRNDSPICVSPVVKPLTEVSSPRITIKPILKPDNEESILKSVLEDKLTVPEFSHTKTLLQTHLEKHSPKLVEERPVKVTIKPVHKIPDNPKITIKPIVKPQDQCLNEDRPAKITIKPIPKLEGNEMYLEERHSPKITIKPIRKPEENQVTKITIKPIPKYVEDFESAMDNQRKIIMKPVVKGSEDLYSEDRHSPKITIKPIPKPDDYSYEERHTKINIKPITKTEFDSTEGRNSPKITIKPIKPPDDMQISVEEQHGSKLIIKPILPVQKLEDSEEKAPRITIKPILKTSDDYSSESNPRITIKPIIKPHDSYESNDSIQGPFKLNIKPIPRPAESSLSPKITIKPVPKQEASSQMELIDFEEQIKQERIVLKIPKNRKTENERVNKIKVKLSKDQGIAQILPVKRQSLEGVESSETKYIKTEFTPDLSVSIVPNTSDEAVDDSTRNPLEKSIKVEKNEDDAADPLSEIPVFEITLESASAMKPIPPPAISIPPAPRKRGRPRKVPLEVREEFKDPKDESVLETIESSRPKRSCRGPSVRATLGIRVRKPRSGSTRGRVGRPPGSKTRKDRRTYSRKKTSVIPELKDFDVKPGDFKHIPLPIDTGNNVVIYEEETRMSAENSSRAHTPAKQVLTDAIDESQSSVQSNATTESGEKLQKLRKGPRLEVHQEPEGEVISADKLAEYSWGGGGPYMLQEQVAQFLGIKSFKRKYPGIQRRPVDMQERDFIRESCLASEAMCDMGLTAVKSEDILDIMYTDFQHKYEEYCKHQRDRQAKDVSNKQKALSLAASQEKNKLDIVEQAVQSAFQWNANFNKARKEQRRACLDLQTFTVHFPKGKMKQINKPPLGIYPIALVPGQYSDYYRKYTPLELGKLPLNTIARKLITAYQDTEDSQSDGSGSDSDSSSSDTDSSFSGSSMEDCKMCGPVTHVAKKIATH